MSASFPTQPTLFDRGAPAFDPELLPRARRVALDDSAWIEHLPSFVTGEDALLAELVRSTNWRRERREMYDRIVDVPRLVASLPEDGPMHPLLPRIAAALSARYGVDFTRVGLGYYRNGADSVAWHGDYVARELPEAVVATVSLGAPRRFLLRPREGGLSQAFMLGRGDLFVMGGACQRTWRHSVPKVASALPRLAVMFRPVWTKI